MTDEKPNPIRLVLNNAEPAQPAPREETQSASLPTVSAGGGGGAPIARVEREDGLPFGCPIVPLGVMGERCCYIDAHRQVREVKARDHSHLNIRQMFGDQPYLLSRWWPRYSRDGKSVTGFRPEEVAEDLMRAAARKGVWNAFQRLRGPGAWLDEDGGLVLHAGDKIWIEDLWQEPGHIAGRYVYPAGDPQPRPSRKKANKDAAEAALRVIRTWRWKRPELDPELLLGWLAAAMIGGALDWRPMGWITGDKATGKSTLQKLINQLMGGDQALLQIADASAPGIWQKLGMSSLPVVIDELEADEDNRRAQSIIKLARLAASGGVVLRGGADHQSAEFKARSCFLFSSILVPPLPPQDRSRMAILELGALTNIEPPTLKPRELAEIGTQLRRRLVDQWGRYADTLHRYRSALAGVGHTGRGADQFGTILTCLDLLRHDEAPDTDSLDEWAEKLKPTAQDMSEENADHYRCVQHLLTQTVDVFKGGRRRTVGELVEQAMGIPENDGENPNVNEAKSALGTLGLRVALERESPAGDRAWWLAVANNHQGTANLFKGSHWSGGVWVQAWSRVVGARPSDSPRHFAGTSSRCWLLPLGVMMPESVRVAKELGRDV